MKKILIPVIALCILLSSCWDLVESEKLGLMTLIGIDVSNDDQIKVVAHELSDPKQASIGQQGGAAQKTPVKVHEAVAPSISEAVEKINASNFHRTYFADASAIILSEELVYSKGFSTFIDYFERTPEIRRNTWFLISTEGQFGEIFSTGNKLEVGDDIGKIIRGIIDNKSRTSFITTNTLGDFLNLFWETGSEPYTSGISLIETNTGEENQASGTGSSEAKSSELSIGNTAVFKNDKLAGWLDNNESMGLLWVKGDIKGGNLPIYVDEKEILLKIVRMNSDIKPLMVNGKMQMNISIKVLSNVGESQAKLVYSNVQVRKMLENLQAEAIKKQILEALDKSRQLDSDVFGFGNYFFGKYPKDWKLMETRGYDYYRNVAVNIDVSSTVNQIGLVRENQRH